MPDQQEGRLLLIDISDGLDPEGFDHLGGLKTRSISLATEETDDTVPNTANPANPVQRLAGVGIQTRTFTGDGLFEDNAALTRAITAAVNGTPIRAQVSVPGVGTFTGPWIITNLEFSGEMTGKMAYSCTFSASDYLTFVAAA